MRILITDFYCTYNAGDAAILEGMLAALRAAFANPSFTVSTSWPGAAERRHRIAAVPPLVTLPSAGGRWQSRLLTRLTWRMRRMALAKAVREGPLPLTDALMQLCSDTLRAYQEADLVLSCGGGFLNDTYYLGLIRRLYGFLTAKRLGKPLMLYAQSIGPFRQPLYARLAGDVLNRVDVITTRDRPSLTVLGDLGVTRPYRQFTADAALVLRPDDEAAGRRILSEAGVDLRRWPLIGFSVRRWTYPDAPDPAACYETYLAIVAQAADHAYTRYDAEIVFLSTAVGEEGYPADDRRTAREVIARMEHRGVAKVVEAVLMPQEIQAALRCLDLFIATRMHALILATASHVPAIGIAYEAKTPAYMAELGLEELACDIRTMRAETLTALIERAWAERDQIRAQLERTIPILARRAAENATIAQRLVKGELYTP